MYAERYDRPHRLNPAGLTAAVAINAAVIAALMMSAPTILPGIAKRSLTMIDVFTPPPPPPEPVPPPPSQAQSRQPVERIDAPVTPFPPIAARDFAVPDLPPLPPPGPMTGADGGTAVTIDPAPPPPLPTLIEPSFDPRYASQIQPVYPAAERRAGREGRVTVRVLVGVDGRVKQIERVGATSDAFWQATEVRAMSAWRFRPATRGGIPVEAWRTLSLTFVLAE